MFTPTEHMSSAAQDGNFPTYVLPTTLSAEQEMMRKKKERKKKRSFHPKEQKQRKITVLRKKCINIFSEFVLKMK